MKDLSIGYGKKSIVEHINLSIECNKIYGLIGRNGAGKSTFLRTIARLQDELKGSLVLDGETLENVDYFNMDVTFISDEHAFFQDLTMYEQMVFLCKINGMSKQEAIRKIDEVFDRFKLGEYANYYPYALSRGSLQRFALVCGYIRNSRVFLLDEPFITLDPVQVKTLQNVLLEYRNKHTIIIVSSHDLDSLEAICDEYLIIKGKNILPFKSHEIQLHNIAEMIGESYE